MSIVSQMLTIDYDISILHSIKLVVQLHILETTTSYLII